MQEPGRIAALLLAGALSALTPVREARAPATGDGLRWDARAVEHLLNRAAFGATRAEIEHGLAIGPTALVDELLAGRDEPEPFYAQRHQTRAFRMEVAELDEEERRERRNVVRRLDREQLVDFLGWWVERMVVAEDPLRERMTLFWHGHFTSSMQDVKDSYEMIRQNETLREHALGSFGELLAAIARDPAMLEYLDNDANRKGEPNENFARELLELFTLGEGNYDEDDIKEVARAFTGWTDRDGAFVVQRRMHDDGKKTVLGVRGRHDGDDVIAILLEQEACGRHLAAKLLTYFEGVEPETQRIERYSRFLRSVDYELAPFLRKLFLDPAFYRDEVVGTRIASPLDFLVGTVRRAEVEVPPRLVVAGSALLGERLLFPPNVKGWEGGEAWITTASLMQRANLAGVLLGAVTLREVLGLPEPGQKPEMGDAPPVLEGLRELRSIERIGWRPRYHLTHRLRRAGVTGDAAIVEVLCADLLAVEPAPPTRAELMRLLTDEREAAGVAPGELLASVDTAEPILRRLAHATLSLPEAQLH